MSLKKSKDLAGELLSLAGITINGKNSFDIRITDDRFYSTIFSKGELGFGESYMNGWWECDQVDELVYRILKARLDEKIRKNLTVIVLAVKTRLFDLQTKHRAFIVGREHYDLDNELFNFMLDSSMSYSCAYFKDTDSLAEAQQKKLALICGKLKLKSGMKLLDIGCGWGGLAKFAAENYGVKVTGITVSKKQAEFAEDLCKGLPVEIILDDYRNLKGKYDRVVSVGMFEHVGYKNYRTFMKVVHRSLADDGLFLLHTIGSNYSTTSTSPWIQKYIFPNGMLPSIKQIGESIENLFVMENWENYGPHYYKTLMSWHHNFVQNWDRIKDRYDQRFFKMWTYYLLSSAGAFKARSDQLWQVMLSKE